MSRIFRPPRVRETVVQGQIVRALRTIGAAVYEIGRPPHRDDAFRGLRQTPGVPDICAHMPEGPQRGPHTLWIEVKAAGGKLSEAQQAFRDFCLMAGEPHIVGGLDEVLAYLREHGYIRETAHYRQVSLGEAKSYEKARP